MSFDELLPAVRSLPQPDKVRLIQLLAADLLPTPTSAAMSAPILAAGDYPMWSPHDSHAAATGLLAALEADARV